MQASDLVKPIDNVHLVDVFNLIPCFTKHSDGFVDGCTLTHLILFDGFEGLLNSVRLTWIGEQRKHHHRRWFRGRIELIEANEQGGVHFIHPFISPVFFRAIQSRLPWTVFFRPKLVFIEHLFRIHRVVEFVSPCSSHCFRCGAGGVAEVRCSMLKRTGKFKRIFEVKNPFTSKFLIFAQIVFYIRSDPSLCVQFH